MMAYGFVSGIVEDDDAEAGAVAEGKGVIGETVSSSPLSVNILILK